MAFYSKKIGLVSRRASQLKYLPALLGAEPRYLPVQGFSNLDSMAGWGCGWKARFAKYLARKHNLPFYTLEDGLLRSVERSSPPLSLIMDDVGIYYDATSPSLLEQLILKPLSQEQHQRAKALIVSWRSGRVSKYNAAREYNAVLPERYVLVADQVRGDCSVSYGGADENAFDAMLAVAIRQNPDCTILVKTHPDSFTRRRRGYFYKADMAKHDRVQWVNENCHPVRLIENCECVYTVTSQIGFEALIWGKPVHCFGMPFYAGWGLTQDTISPPDRRANIPLEQLVHAALVEYPHYIDPETNERCEVEHLLHHIAFQRSMRERLPKRLHAIGISRWKQPILGRFTAGSSIHFHRTEKTVPDGADILVWGRRAYQCGIRARSVHSVEDGFLRSVGLGADFVQPLSWVFDDLGIYYDATMQSRLECILSTIQMDAGLLKKTEVLSARIVKAQMSKYNSQVGTWQRPDGRTSVILVIGQVETDASLRFGSPSITTNLDLLRAVRKRNPTAYIVYKPHPDVVAGLRRGGADEDCISAYCDATAPHAGLPQMLAQVDEVHTMTSLAGFEALLRHVPVTCYGQPFYAGWGLTTDMFSISRRNRKLNLNELTAGTLILYPVYVSRVTGRYTTPERALDELIGWRKQSRTRLPLWRSIYRLLMRVAKMNGTKAKV